ncbi:DEAD/DEAH box helicase [Aeoliella mucimassa]|uniref:DEAD/DEAH box helicase n=1 Tax=Aeoliella mucimassa TaxID=2527972 RepID=UPI0036F45A01
MSDLTPTTNPSSSSHSSAQFSELGVSEVMLASLEKAQYHQPSPVQAGVIPLALEGKDVLGQARTGTGKTASFGIPILERLERQGRSAPPQALVLVPTRELAVQVRDEIDKLSHGSKVRTLALYGGKPIRQQVVKLEKGAEIVVGTPGRVLDHMSRGTLVLEGLKMVVLDEADRMLDIGFRPDIEKILRRCPKTRQTLLLSATVAPAVERLAQRYMRDPEVLDFSDKTKTVDTIDQYYFTIEQSKKYDLLVKLLEREQPEQAIVFCRTKRGTDRIQRKLSKSFPGADCIHGDMHQRARDKVMKRFRAGEIKLLVATDVVGRGIDVSGISHIVNYDIPQASDDYVHRVGRTGRMGREGVAYTFVTPEEGQELTRIEMLINRLLKRDEIEGFAVIEPVAGPSGPAGPSGAADAPKEEEKPKPAPLPGSRRGRRHRRAL